MSESPRNDTLRMRRCAAAESGVQLAPPSDDRRTLPSLATVQSRSESAAKIAYGAAESLLDSGSHPVPPVAVHHRAPEGFVAIEWSESMPARERRVFPSRERRD
jgi:hypothetical protein